MKKVWYGAVFALAIANIAVWPYVLRGNALRVTFFDVGQGDAMFIETPQGHHIIIDGGPDNKMVEKIGHVLPFWDKTIDLMISTHPDADHVSGLADVFSQYDVKNVLWTGMEKDTNIYVRWKKALDEEHANILLARAGERLTWSQDPAAYIDILSPDETEIAEAKQVNDTSIVSKLVYGIDSFLFTGDISDAVEQRLVADEVSLEAGVLKAPHHGSKTSNSSPFLAAVAPQLAVIEVGAHNQYGHPTKEALARFADFAIPVLRTDENSDILIQTYGTGTTVATNR